MLSAVTTFSACWRHPVVYLVCGCMLSMCVCVPDVLVCGMFVCEDGQTIVTETCRVLMMCFTNIFNNLEF